MSLKDIIPRAPVLPRLPTPSKDNLGTPPVPTVAKVMAGSPGGLRKS